MEKKPNYKDTLNLPQTQLPMRANLPQREPEILKRWQEMDIYKAILTSSGDRPRYVLHDGPPYANGHIHMGHVLNKVLKDIILKYKTMRGYSCPYIPGWDCHGLPVEHQLFKELGMTKDEISRGVFRKKARKYALKHVNIQKKEFERLGIFADWDNPYLTLNNNYEAQIIKSFSELVKKDFIYKGRKPVNWCYHCETALAEAEVEYDERTSPSIFVKFKLAPEDKKQLAEKAGLSGIEAVGSKEIYFIVWTTTPWTLLANIGIALSPALKYSLVMVNNELWILADALLPALSKKLKMEDYQKVKEVNSGSAFAGLRCEHPLFSRQSVILPAEYVSGEEGTGCVHLAPGHGQDDYETWLKHKRDYKDLEFIMPVDGRGVFDGSVGEFSGMNVTAGNEAIIRRLKEVGRLLLKEDIVHSYQHCWRCKKPIIFRATEQWFMKIDHQGLREKAVNEISNKVEWLPPGSKARILSMVENRPDWCLSRQRYWGVPIPVFYCRDCRRPLLDPQAIDYLVEIVRAESLGVWFEKEAEELLPAGTKCPGCSHSNFVKEYDILDVWFDSGVSHQAVLRQREGLSYPADLYLEGSDQHRGWFQTSLLTAMAIEGGTPYKKVLTHGFIVDGEGKKMSKSLGNAMSPDDLIKKLGVDILRLWAASSDYNNDVNLSEEILARVTDAYRKIRNTIRFTLGNIYDFEVDRDKVEYDELFEIDKWALDTAKRLYDECLEFYESFQFHKAAQRIYNFCTVDMSSFYLDVLKDRLYTWGKKSAGRRSAQTVLWSISALLVKLIAPILSFSAEEIWSYLPGETKEESVFLSRIDAGGVEARWRNEEIRGRWRELLNVRELVLKSLELKRGDKVIGNALEAEVILKTKSYVHGFF